MVLEVLTDSIIAEAAIIPEFQRVANEAVARAMCADKLPARPLKSRPPVRIFDDPRKAAAVRQYLKESRWNDKRKMLIREFGASGLQISRAQISSKEKIAEKIGGDFGTVRRNLQRWASDAEKEGRIPAADVASVSPEVIAEELGIAPDILPPPGTWTLTVDEHGPVNRPHTSTDDNIPMRPWPPKSKDD